MLQIDLYRVLQLNDVWMYWNYKESVYLNKLLIIVLYWLIHNTKIILCQHFFVSTLDTILHNMYIPVIVHVIRVN